MCSVGRRLEKIYRLRREAWKLQTNQNQPKNQPWKLYQKKCRRCRNSIRTNVDESWKLLDYIVRIERLDKRLREKAASLTRQEEVVWEVFKEWLLTPLILCIKCVLHETKRHSGIHRLVTEEGNEILSALSTSSKLPYRELVRALNYLAVASPLNITYTCSFQGWYGRTHWNASKKILRYLSSYKSLRGFVDRPDRRKVLHVWFGTWNSRKQTPVAL